MSMFRVCIDRSTHVKPLGSQPSACEVTTSSFPRGQLSSSLTEPAHGVFGVLWTQRWQCPSACPCPRCAFALPPLPALGTALLWDRLSLKLNQASRPLFAPISWPSQCCSHWAERGNQLPPGQLAPARRFCVPIVVSSDGIKIRATRSNVKPAEGIPTLW